MHIRNHDRREFLAGIGLGVTALLGSPALRAADARSDDGPFVSINQWSVGAMRGRDKRRAGLPLEEELAELAACGINGLEPGVTDAAHATALAANLTRHGLAMPSVYIASELVDPAGAEKEIARVVALARCAKALGARIIVTNPSPLPGRRGKTDAQLTAQAAGLDHLGHALAAQNLTLAYHNHDVELEHAAREFHHMMLATDPANLSLCLDAHWVYRGAGHSQVSLFDVVKLYGKRVVELHLRQSNNHIWSEAFGTGDIDYPALWKALAALGVKPLLVLEQGPEQGTPQTIEIAEAHRRSCHHAREVFSTRP